MISLYTLFSYRDANWHYISVVWTSETGAWVFYLDGSNEASGTGLSTGTFVKGRGMFVVGQEQDTYNGSYVAKESFIGSLSQVRFIPFCYAFCWCEYIVCINTSMIFNNSPMIKSVVKIWKLSYKYNSLNTSVYRSSRYRYCDHIFDKFHNAYFTHVLHLGRKKMPF